MSESQSLKRPRFFPGKLLTPEDLELEQEYFREKFKRHNRSLHGFGIVSGLKITVDAGQIIVGPGLALDCEGNELVIGCAQSMDPSMIAVDWHTAYVNLRFAEQNVDRVSSSTGNETSNVTESFELAFATENCNQSHRHLRARWLTCGQAHPLTIAKLKHSSQGWRVDRGYRPPKIR
jgi:hypothetical protein